MIAIVGGGICGLTLALNLHERGIPCTVYERAPNVRELGVGITLLPHAMREFAALGLEGPLKDAGIDNEDSCFYNRFGQLIYREPRGSSAGYPYPEVGIHRGRLHRVLHETACARLGPDRILGDHECVGVEDGDRDTTVRFRESSSGRTLPPVRAAAVVACDGIHSVVRRQFYPDERIAFAGINTWRGVTRRPPILTGRSYLRVGSIRTGKMVIYPIADNVDGHGSQLVNWLAEIQQDVLTMNDWSTPGRIEDFIGVYESWRFDWLDVPALIRTADRIIEYPMVDRDPVPRWTFGRVTLAGDAAHPMYPRGSNGAAQAVIDARVLAEHLRAHADPSDGLVGYEEARRETTARIVRTNREQPPDFINIRVEELVGDRPFANLDAYISQEELRGLSERYKEIAGFSVANVRP